MFYPSFATRHFTDNSDCPHTQSSWLPYFSPWAHPLDFEYRLSFATRKSWHVDGACTPGPESRLRRSRPVAEYPAIVLLQKIVVEL